MINAETVERIREKFAVLQRELDERGRRLWAASEASALGRGGIQAVVEATGLAVSTVRGGCQELRRPAPADEPRRVRAPGGGRKRLTDRDPRLSAALEALVEPTTRGDPMSPLRWTCKSTRNLSDELARAGHPVSHTVVAELLAELGYSLQGNQKAIEGASHPDRNAQFEHISKTVSSFQRRGQPVVSVDTKKKELIGDFVNKGREYQPKGKPVRVRVHDFIDPKLGKVIPYGVYDLTRNCGWVSVGIDHDTAEFAVETLRRWWRKMGAVAYPRATELLITADGGGSNGSRLRLWKVELQKFADETGLKVSVCHFPPGTSKWNKIEHRMFCHITQNWRGRPLTSHETVVNLIANTRTETGLHIRAQLDRGKYNTEVKITDEEMASLHLVPSKFHGADWNYAIASRTPRKPPKPSK
jgi:hypothetical protein